MITREKILFTAINEYGVDSQICQFHEEVGELMQAINKVRRNGGIRQEGILKPGPNSSIKYAKSYFDLCSEVADVQIMLDQLKMMLDIEAISLAEVRKVERLKERLEL